MLRQSRLLQEKLRLTKACRFWESVESHADVLLASDEFRQLRKHAVEALAQRDLEVEETFIYDNVVAWAKAECAR